MKYFFFFLLIFLFSCKKENFKEDFSYFIGKNFLVQSYQFKDLSTGERYDLLDNREIDTIYLIFRENSMYLGKVENLMSGGFGLGVDKYLLEFKNNEIGINRDNYNEFFVVSFSKNLLTIEGRHILHNQKQRIEISILEMNYLTPNLEELIIRFVEN